MDALVSNYIAYWSLHRKCPQADLSFSVSLGVPITAKPESKAGEDEAVRGRANKKGLSLQAVCPEHLCFTLSKIQGWWSLRALWYSILRSKVHRTRLSLHKDKKHGLKHGYTPLASAAL